MFKLAEGMPLPGATDIITPAEGHWNSCHSRPVAVRIFTFLDAEMSDNPGPWQWESHLFHDVFLIIIRHARGSASRFQPVTWECICSSSVGKVALYTLAVEMTNTFCTLLLTIIPIEYAETYLALMGTSLWSRKGQIVASWRISLSITANPSYIRPLVEGPISFG